MKLQTRLVVPFVVVGLLPIAVQAGPPLTCFPMSIGEARSLPWGNGSKTPDPRYDRARLADDTLGLLGAETPVVVRMETLRRAAYYAAADEAAAKRLLQALRARASGPDSRGAEGLALFDLGYAVETYRQAGHLGRGKAVDPPEDGYALVRRALALRGSDPAMEYAAALIVAGRDHALSQKHLKSAVLGARAGSDLERTIAAQEALWRGRVAEYRASAR